MLAVLLTNCDSTELIRSCGASVALDLTLTPFSLPATYPSVLGEQTTVQEKYQHYPALFIEDNDHLKRVPRTDATVDHLEVIFPIATGQGLVSASEVICEDVYVLKIVIAASNNSTDMLAHVRVPISYDYVDSNGIAKYVVEVYVEGEKQPRGKKVIDADVDANPFIK
jgi:hypothetical protein